MKLKGLIPAAAILLVLPAGAFALGQNEAPLPKVETVLQRVAEQAEKEEANTKNFRQRYAFTHTRVTEYKNAKGEVKKREEKKKLRNPALTKTAPQSPLAVAKSPKAEDKADQPVSESNSKVRGKAFKNGDFVLNDDLLSRFDFTVVGREVVNGRPAVVVDFLPAKKQPSPRSIKDRFINKAGGRVWVDEADHALVKVDLRLTEHVNVVGGLVGAVKTFTYQFLRERTPEGFWYVRNSNWHLEGREVFVHRTVDFREERSDVRRVDRELARAQSIDAAGMGE